MLAQALIGPHFFIDPCLPMMTNCLHDMGWTSLAKPASPIIGWGKDSNCIVEPSLQTPLLAVN